MKYLTHIGRLVCSIVALQGLVIGQAGAQSIGLNFEGRSGENAVLDSAAVAGVVPQANWINVPNNESNGFDGTLSNLEDSEGDIATISFEWIANDAWNSNVAGAATPDEQLMEGIQKCNPDDGNFEQHANSRMTFYFRGLLAGSTYNVIVYQAHNGGVAKSVTSIGGVTYYAEQGTEFDGTFTRSTTTDGTFPVGIDYVQFDNVSPDENGTIEIVAEKFLEDPELADGMGVPGVQLVKVTGDWPMVTDPPVISTDPQDFLGIVGDQVTLSIVTDGPWTIEWYKNDVMVQSGLSTTYSFESVEADKDAVVYAKAINTIGEATSATATITLDDPQPEQLIQGFMRGEHYANIGGTVVFPDLYNHPPFQARDYDFEFFTLGGDAPPTNPDLNDFGRIFEGWVVPDTTEDYTFFGNSDDAFELFVVPTGGTAEALPAHPTDFASEFPDATETSWQSRYVYFEPPADQTTNPFALTAGQYYAFVMLYKEGGGGDHASVAWRAASDTTPVSELRPIGPENVFCLASPAGKRAEITEHPVSQSVEQGRITSFSVAAETLPRANEFAVQWTRDGANIPGEIGFTYTTDRTTLADDGAVIQAKVYTLVGLVESDPATLTVTADTTAPNLLSGGVFTGGTSVGLRFDEALDAASATTAGNYAVSGTTVTDVALVGSDDNIVILTLSAAPSAGATVTVTGVTDFSGNAASSTPAALEESAMVPQQLVRAEGTDPVEPGLGAYLGDDSFFIEAGGSDIWDNQDSGYQVTEDWTGPLDVRVRVVSLIGPDVWTKGGIMVRESTAGGARNVGLFATPTAGQNIYQWQWRDTADEASGSVDAADRPGPVNYPDAWLRIVRPDASSNLFESYTSDNGVNWTFYADHTIPGDVLPETVVVSIATTSHNNGEGQVADSIYADFSISTPSLEDAPVLEGISLDGANMTIQWSNGGELESAPAVEGPWTGTGDSDGEYSEPLGAEAQKFFRANQ